MSSTARSDDLHHHQALPLPVAIRPIRGARRLRLRVDQARGCLTLTGPARMNRRAALDWAAKQADWVRDQLAAQLPDEPFVPGATIPVEGADTLLDWDLAAPRNPVLTDGRLSCGGPADAFSRRIASFLRKRALGRLGALTAEIAGGAGLTVDSVSIGDAGTRWGSCTQAGRIRYSWRLILAPPSVLRFVVAHEVAHLAHLDHGPDFRRLEAKLYDGDVAAARALLRGWGPRLKRIGRGG